jgi:hypothetical protein
VDEILNVVGTGSRINRVTAVRGPLVASETEYAQRMNDPASIYSMPPRQPGISSSTADDVSWAYDTRFTRRVGGARGHYNALRAKSRKCPICRQRDSGALDHFLPRETYPSLAIQPTNLVPICGPCNTRKEAQVALSADKQFLHPYFDDLGGDDWLYATFEERIGAPVLYYVDRPARWDDLLFARVVNHFEFFGISDLYGAQAATTLGGYKKLLTEKLERDPIRGPLEVRRTMLETAGSIRSFGAEPWLAAALQAWGESDWFCNGGWA